MRRCVWCLVAGGVFGLGVGLAYRAVRGPAPKPSPPSAINVAPPGTAGPRDEATWRYRLCQPRHWRYLLLNR
jgi:hypothetical protein